MVFGFFQKFFYQFQVIVDKEVIVCVQLQFIVWFVEGLEEVLEGFVDVSFRCLCEVELQVFQDLCVSVIFVFQGEYSKGCGNVYWGEEDVGSVGLMDQFSVQVDCKVFQVCSDFMGGWGLIFLGGVCFLNIFSQKVGDQVIQVCQKQQIL